MAVLRGLREFGTGFMVAVLAFTSLVLLASPAQAAWVDNNCPGNAYDVTTWKRSQAKSYVGPATLEGYEWGGGCYKLNDIDDTPGAPDSGGEGRDCSGFTFTGWHMKITYGASGFRHYDLTRNVHGPYATVDFYSPCATCPYARRANKDYATTVYMDAFVYNISGAGHIGFINSEGTGGFDWIIEAKGDVEGTRLAWTDYRAQSKYVAIYRKGWTPECYPQCA
jgi:hypothetical protein